MANELVRSGSTEHIFSSMYQLDPAFYRKIIFRNHSRNDSIESSFGKSGYYHYGASGKIPFDWEMKPGEPIEDTTKPEIIPPIRPPPGVLGRYFLPRENVKKLNKTSKIQVKLARAIRRRLSLSLPRRKTSLRKAKAYLMKHVKQITNGISHLIRPNEKCDTKKGVMFHFGNNDNNDNVNDFCKSSISLSESLSPLSLSLCTSSFTLVSIVKDGKKSWKMLKVIKKLINLKS